MFVRQHPIYKIITFMTLLLVLVGGMVMAAPVEGNASAMRAFQVEETFTSTPTPLFNTPTPGPTLTPTLVSGVLSCNTVAANVTCTNYGTYLKYDINILVTGLTGGASATSIPIGTFKRTTTGGYLGLMTDFIHGETSNYAKNKVSSGVWIKPTGYAEVRYPSFASGAGKDVWVHHNIMDWRVVPGTANSVTTLTVRGNIDYPITGYSVVGTIYIYSNEMFVTVTPTPTATFTVTPSATSVPTTPAPNSYGFGYCWFAMNTWNSHTATYSIDRNTILVSRGWDGSIFAAAQTWNNVGPSPFQFVFDPNGGGSMISFQVPPNPEFLAQVSPHYLNPFVYVTEKSMDINPIYDWDTNNVPDANDPDSNGTYFFNIQNVVTHEFGHFLQLGDITAEGCADVTMYHYVYPGEIKKMTLDVADVNALNLMYP